VFEREGGGRAEEGREEGRREREGEGEEGGGKQGGLEGGWVGGWEGGREYERVAMRVSEKGLGCGEGRERETCVGLPPLLSMMIRPSENHSKPWCPETIVPHISRTFSWHFSTSVRPQSADSRSLLLSHKWGSVRSRFRSARICYYYCCYSTIVIYHYSYYYVSTKRGAVRSRFRSERTHSIYDICDILL
jgi:hypothetical protein